jgi:hypothetical protein
MAQPVDVEIGNKVVAPADREKDNGIVQTTSRYLIPIRVSERLME